MLWNNYRRDIILNHKLVSENVLSSIYILYFKNNSGSHFLVKSTLWIRTETEDSPNIEMIKRSVIRDFLGLTRICTWFDNFSCDWSRKRYNCRSQCSFPSFSHESRKAMDTPLTYLSRQRHNERILGEGFFPQPSHLLLCKRFKLYVFIFFPFEICFCLCYVLCMCVFAMWVCVCRVQKRALDTLEPDSCMIMSSLAWVLGTQVLWQSGRCS